VSRSTERIFDEYLAASARAGSRAALTRLAERWQARLLAHAARLTADPDAARDVVQEAWVEIVRSLPRLDDAAAFPAWAFRIVTRRSARWVRGRQRGRRLAAAVGGEPQSAPAADPDRRLDAARVASAIASLPADQRAAVALFYLEDMSVAEIAVALDAPAGTIKTRLMHARDRLRAILSLKETRHEPA
jgi:RNA polymerase sigma factor (sigma-70 family)